MREDLIGIALAVIGIALFVAVIVPGNAMLTVAISDALKHVLGLGAYVVPFVLVFWGATFFFKTEGVKVGRLVIGLRHHARRGACAALAVLARHHRGAAL